MGVIELEHEKKEGNGGEIDIWLLETDDQGQKKENGVTIYVVVLLTTFGFKFLTALDLIEKRLVSIDWDEFERPSADPNPGNRPQDAHPGPPRI